MAACTVRVGRALGAGRPARAWEEVKTASLVVGIVEAIFWALSLFVLRDRLTALYSSDPAVISMATAALLPYLTHNLFDGINGVLQASLRGCGRQRTTATVSLATWYLLTLPILLHWTPPIPTSRPRPRSVANSRCALAGTSSRSRSPLCSASSGNPRSHVFSHVLHVGLRPRGLRSCSLSDHGLRNRSQRVRDQGTVEWADGWGDHDMRRAVGHTRTARLAC